MYALYKDFEVLLIHYILGNDTLLGYSSSHLINDQDQKYPIIINKTGNSYYIKDLNELDYISGFF
jgi:hypothetical protein